MGLVVGPEVVRWVAARTNEFGSFGTETGLGWERDGKLVAGVAYADWNGPNVMCHIASDGSRRWASRALLFAIFDYPFRQLGCRRMTACIGQGNSNSRRFVEHLGFVRETTLLGAHPTGDLLVYVMVKEKCRWLMLGRHLEHSLRLKMAA